MKQLILTTVKFLCLTLIITITAACSGAGNQNSASNNSNGGASGGGSTPSVVSYKNSLQFATPALIADTNCLKIINSTTTGSAWYKTGTFAIQNTCSEPQSINGTQILIAADKSLTSIIDYASIQPNPWANVSASFDSEQSAGSNTDIVMTLIADPLVMQSTSGVTTVSFGYNSPDGVDIGNFTYTIKGQTPVKNGNINLVVDATALKGECTTQTSCNIPLTLTGQSGQFESIVLVINNQTAGQIVQESITNLNPGLYKLAAANLPDQITFNAPDITVSSNATVTENALFAKTTPTTGTLILKLDPIADPVFSAESVAVTVEKASTTIYNPTMQFGQSVTINKVNADTYNLNSIGLADAIRGVYYAPINNKASVSVGQTTTAKLDYSQESANDNVSLIASGLDQGDSAIVTITDNMHRFEKITLTGDTTSAVAQKLKMLDATPVTINVQVPQGYKDIAPSTITPTDGESVTLSFISTAPSGIQFCSDQSCSESLSSVALRAESTTQAVQTIYIKNMSSKKNTGAITDNFNPITGLAITLSPDCKSGIQPQQTCPITLTYNGQPTVQTASTIYFIKGAALPNTYDLNVTVTTKSANQGVLAGYLATGYETPVANRYITIDQAVNMGYNVVILAFAEIDGSNNINFEYSDSFPLGFSAYDNGDGAPTGSESICKPNAIAAMKQDIAKHKADGSLMYTLISIGGSGHTVNIPQTQDQIQQLAQNIVTFLKTYDLDGVDFDIENAINGNNFHQLLQAIRTEAARQGMNQVILTAAPQANSLDSNNPYLVDFVTTSIQNNFDIAIQNSDFDYVWLQGYNTGAATNLIHYNGQNVDETMAEYIPAAYNYFINNQNTHVTVPRKTQVIIGEPVTIDAVQQAAAAVWYNPKYSNADAVYSALAANYSKLSQPSAMAWTINHDTAHGCQFAQKISGIIGTTFKNCPADTDKYTLQLPGCFTPQN